ncbi:MAG: MerR family transcriptional regulator, partial [Propionibacteriaceae bacterium]
MPPANRPRVPASPAPEETHPPRSTAPRPHRPDPSTRPRTPGRAADPPPPAPASSGRPASPCCPSCASLPTKRLHRQLDTSAAEADARTRYRHYTAEQLPRLNRILALRDLGFTLAEIRSVVTETITADQLRGMLLLRRAELQLTHDETASRLTNVEIRLNQIEQES